MFSNLRNAVEGLAQPGVRTESPSPRPGTPQNSTSHLAESALLNLRKSLSAQRASSPMTSSESLVHPQPHHANGEPRTRKMTLEDRLKASFVVGDSPSPVGTPANDSGMEKEKEKGKEKELEPVMEKDEKPLPPDPLQVPLPMSPPLEPKQPFLDPLAAAPAPVELPPLPPIPTEAETQPLPGVRPQSPISPQKDRPQSPTPQSPQTTQPQVTTAPIPPLILEPPLSPGPDAIDVGSPFSLEPQSVDEAERLRARVKLVERRFADVSTSFKRLQAEKKAADQVLQDLTPLESITDTQGLRDHLRNLSLKTELSHEEIKNLTARIRQHDDRLQEVRDMHRLETASQSEQVEKLQRQLQEAQENLQSTLNHSSAASVELQKKVQELDEVKKELEKSQNVAKEEEEKRTKAISLLKTMRQKVMKAEKDKEDVAAELAKHKEAETAAREKEKADLEKLDAEVTRIKNEREKDIANLRTQFGKDLASTRETFEKEATTRKAQYELDIITMKAAHSKELTTKNATISQLESSNQLLTQEKETVFDQLQQRQAELESSQSQLELVQNQLAEVQYQLRESNDKVAQLQDELSSASSASLQSPSFGKSLPNGIQPQKDVARMLSEAEGKYEVRLAELRAKMRGLEKERNEAEEEWSRNLQERSREVERLRKVVEDKDREYAESVRTRKMRDEKVEELLTADAKHMEERRLERIVVENMKKDVLRAQENEALAKEEQATLLAQIESMERLAEEAKSREQQLRTSNKTLRDEMRKVQSSAALLEKQRNPGVGYWGSANNPTSPRKGNSQLPSTTDLPATASTSDLTSTHSGSSRPASPPSNPEEDVNLEYLRNVIFQFLEHKEMRPNLVKVLSIILRFTPQETRRLMAKV